MKPLDLLTENEWPEGFSYPRQFRRVIEHGLTELEPWYFLEGRPLRDTMHGLAERYSGRKLIPFARRQDNDDVACWQVGASESVFIIHDFASPGWEQRGQFASFYEWLRSAVEDFVEFDS
ncbi:MAG: hypothetical protein HUU30_13145 [Burkholderiaceae bacterium]|nr:hypothetical protein [Aquabacterium sp.]NUP86679.1 hypothetical protein [Burkholderiaceae bacterium]